MLESRELLLSRLDSSLSVDDESLRSLGSHQLLLQLRETFEVRGSFEFEKLATATFVPFAENANAFGRG